MVSTTLSTVNFGGDMQGSWEPVASTEILTKSGQFSRPLIFLGIMMLLLDASPLASAGETAASLIPRTLLTVETTSLSN